MGGYHILGSPVLDELEADVMAVGRRVRPWLWVLSIFGFGMALQRALGGGR